MTPPEDVRWKGFGSSLDLDQAFALLRERVRPLGTEEVPLDDALDRVLAEDVLATQDVPPFARAAVDGFAVRAQDTFGAGSFDPIELQVVGEVFAGQRADRALGPREAIRVMTGAPVPAGADAVVMREHGEERDARVRLVAAIAPGKNVVARGEDVKTGDTLATRGRRLRPEDVGVLASVRRRAVVVRRRPSVVVFSTGNELEDPLSDAPLREGAIADSSSRVLTGLARRAGVNVRRGGILKDDRALVKEALARATEDIVVTSGAASVGKEDWLPLLVQELGELWVHGIAIRPAHPTGFGKIGERLAFVLPGNPVASWLAFRLFVRPALRLLEGEPASRAFERGRTVRGRLARKIASVAGRTDFARVTLGDDGSVEPYRQGGAAALTTLTRAHGIVVVPKELEGLEAGMEVDVEILE